MPKITVNVDDETYERIRKEADVQDRTITAQARRILRRWLPGDEDAQLKLPDELIPKINLPAGNPYVGSPWPPPTVRWSPEPRMASTTAHVEPGDASLPQREESEGLQ